MFDIDKILYARKKNKQFRILKAGFTWRKRLLLLVEDSNKGKKRLFVESSNDLDSETRSYINLFLIKKTNKCH
jgi:hypothetical protein